MTTLTLQGDHITLANAVKIAGFAESGGQAKHLVRGGSVRVNDAVEIRPGRKLTAGDRFQVGQEAEWCVKAQ
jgi:ribosome-associated protein